MARLADLPVEILRLILREVPHGSYNDIRTIQLARIHPLWAVILYEDFERKYYFMNTQFVKETWNYLILSGEAFMILNSHQYAKTLPVEQLGPEGCSIWIDGFKLQRDELEKRESNSHSPPGAESKRKRHRWLLASGILPRFVRRIIPP